MLSSTPPGRLEHAFEPVGVYPLSQRFHALPPFPVLDDPVLGPLTDDLLTADVRVYQRIKGHRFSSDDMATAFRPPGMRRTGQGGCRSGLWVRIGVAYPSWKMPHAELVGVEAQEMSYELVRRNLARSGFSGRVTVHHGDLRHARNEGSVRGADSTS